MHARIVNVPWVFFDEGFLLPWLVSQTILYYGIIIAVDER